MNFDGTTVYYAARLSGGKMSDERSREGSGGRQSFDALGLGLSSRQIENIAQMHRELRNLRFVNPGEAAVVPLGDTYSRRHGVRRSTRHRKLISVADRMTDYIPHHDEQGFLIKADGHRVKLCDCLRTDCSGCHYRCEKCGSRMCGPTCQKNRDFIIESFVTESEPPRIHKHPYYDPAKREG